MAPIEGKNTRIEINGEDIGEYVERIEFGVRNFARAMREASISVREAEMSIGNSIQSILQPADALDTGFHPGDPPSDDLDDLLDRISEGLREHRDTKSS